MIFIVQIVLDRGLVVGLGVNRVASHYPNTSGTEIPRKCRRDVGWLLGFLASGDCIDRETVSCRMRAIDYPADYFITR